MKFTSDRPLVYFVEDRKAAKFHINKVEGSVVEIQILFADGRCGGTVYTEEEILKLERPLTDVIENAQFDADHLLKPCIWEGEPVEKKSLLTFDKLVEGKFFSYDGLPAMTYVVIWADEKDALCFGIKLENETWQEAAEAFKTRPPAKMILHRDSDLGEMAIVDPPTDAVLKRFDHYALMHQFDAGMFTWTDRPLMKQLREMYLADFTGAVIRVMKVGCPEEDAIEIVRSVYTADGLFHGPFANVLGHMVKAGMEEK
jgi:hypothetical protein